MTDLLYYLLLFSTGVIAGFINTIAGGGSNITLPALMIMGMPADVANATNRVGVALQCMVGTAGFHKQGSLELNDTPLMLGIALTGGLAGAIAASFMPNLYLKPILLTAMIIMAFIILVSPSIITPPANTPIKRIKDSPIAIGILLMAGFYGGFIQAGVGFILIGAIAGTLRYDLLRTNAIKSLIILGFSLVALIVFIPRGQVAWVPGLVLAAGSMIGAYFSVHVAIKISQQALKWFIFLMTLIISAIAMLV